MRSKSKTILAIFALVAGTLCFQTNVEAQGFRIGNVVQAGGGQGFRMGGPRVGMHFGGGQGASFGVGRLGMRFGNGQGARIGGQAYGMQFGGQQGTQIGRFVTSPSVQPGTYYYGDVNGSYPMGVAPVYGMQQATYVESVGVAPVGSYPVGTPMQPYSAAPQAMVPQTGPIAGTAGANAIEIPGTVEPTLATANDVGSQPTPAGLSNNIRLTHSTTATENMSFSLNGTDFTLEPGKSMNLETGGTWNMKFSAGDEHGDRIADLTKAGSYVFMSSPSEGWVLMDEQQMNAGTTENVQVNETAEVVPADDAVPATEESVMEVDVAPLDAEIEAPPALDAPATPEEILDSSDDQ